MTSLDIGGDPAKQLCEQFLPVSGTFERPAWIPLLQGTVSELARKLYNSEDYDETYFPVLHVVSLLEEIAYRRRTSADAAGVSGPGLSGTQLKFAALSFVH
jgi:hypothetical protein